MTDETRNDVATVPQGQPPAVIGDGPGEVLQAVVALAKDPAVDAAKVDAFLRMQERMEDREAERQFNRAFVRLSAVMPQIPKLGTVNLGSGKGAYAFARWEDMDKVLRPLLIAHGFALTFDSKPRGGDGGGLIVTGHLLHADGHSRAAEIALALDTGAGRNNLQAGGSTLSYGKRYVAEMLLNIVRKGDDDDGKLGGTKFIAQEDAEELREIAKAADAQEGKFLHAMFEGDDRAPRSFDEIEVGATHTAVKNALRARASRNRKVT